MKNVYYPLAGMNYIIDNLSQILKNKNPEKKDAIIIYLSAQVNSYPHVGTMINFTAAFALAKQLKETYQVPVRIRVELLESVTGEEKVIDGIKYYKNLVNEVKIVLIMKFFSFMIIRRSFLYVNLYLRLLITLICLEKY